MRANDRPYVKSTVSIGGTRRQHLRLIEAPIEKPLPVKAPDVLLSDGELVRAADIAMKMVRYLPGLIGQPWSQEDVLLVARALIQVCEQNTGTTTNRV